MATEIVSMKYLTDEYDSAGKPTDDGTDYVFLIRSVKGVDVATIAGAPTEQDLDIKVHLNLYENKQKFGLHPRYVELAREVQGGSGAKSQCLIQKGKIPRKLPILTPTRFAALVERDEAATPPVEGTQIDFGNGLVFRVIKKHPERRDDNPNPV